MKKYLFGLLLLLYAGTLPASQDNDFIAARKAFQAGDARLLATYAERLQNHVLMPYIDYFQFRLYLTTTDTASIKKFISRYQDSVISDRLREEWLKILGKNQQWELFSAEYPMLVNTNTELLCYAYQHRLDAKDNDVLKDAHALWFTANSMPDSCTPVFNVLIASGLISVEDVWTRIRMALEAEQTGVARFINRHVPSHQALDITKLNAAAQNPLRYLEAQRGKIKTRADRETALFALLHLLRNDTNQAYAHWSKVREQLTASDRSYFLGRLAYRAALRHDPRALGWFVEAANSGTSYPLTDTLLAWKARTALRAGNWDIVLKSIESMSTPEQQIDTWRYWKARALKVKGETLDANTLLIPLSTEHSFYGQLAKEELGTILSTPDKLHEPSAEEITAMQRRPGIQRALAFYRLNLRTEAYREWVWAIRDFDDMQLLAAAEVAHRHGMYDRAINTASRTVSQHNFNLRFLAPHRDTLKVILQQHALDEAWVYGLIRQESRFITDIKSSAGAMGLMQLMPATAKWVAQQLGMQDYRESLAVEVNTNLRLGTYYLKHVLTTLDNQPLLASAAYNAGPGRARRWRDVNPLEGAIYAETIPFNETRDYVKKVLKNSMYYAQVLNHDHSAPTLKERLGVVNSK
ncbi:MAG: transglycosylase SLT domain-containing protein [Nitrosomonas sp.]|nr:transglycosylase SLT domain-containing protein [Nitrosomonas sp.]MDP1949600.1 transglycosylase SLT domain-containing protein [Nitrosomonas sp.]